MLDLFWLQDTVWKPVLVSQIKKNPTPIAGQHAWLSWGNLEQILFGFIDDDNIAYLIVNIILLIWILLFREYDEHDNNDQEWQISLIY